jgi:hypothetical protein
LIPDGVVCFLDDYHSDMGEMEYHCTFDLHFSDLPFIFEMVMMKWAWWHRLVITALRRVN